MDLSKYTKIIERLARGLNNGKIDQNQITDFLQKELGTIDPNVDTAKFMTMDEVDKQFEIMEQRRIENEFMLPYQNLKNSFIKILEVITEVEKSKDPFSIKFNAHKIVDNYNILRQYSEDENYDVVRLKTIRFISEYRKDLLLTKEHIKILDKKYL